MIGRRTFLGGSAAGLALAFSRVPTLRADTGNHLIELASRPTNYESVRSTFTERITPLERFFLRNHFDAPVDPQHTWKLSVTGLVGKPLALTLAELAKMKQTTIEAVLQCAGNGRGLFKPRVPGVQWKYGAMGNAEWTGVRLAEVLKAAGVTKDAKHLQLRGADKPVVGQTPPFIRGIPIEKALHPDTLIALKMNGKPLSPLHGFPARLVVPGWVGDDWIKWLTEIDVRAGEAQGFFYDTGYRFPSPPGKPGEAVPPANMQVMTKHPVKSLIGSIEGGARVAHGELELVGVAFSGEARITKVEITLDGSTWQAADLDAHDSDYGFRVFRKKVTVAAGTLTIGSRATDSAGATQPKEPVWNPSGYLHNAVDLVRVEVRA